MNFTTYYSHSIKMLWFSGISNSRLELVPFKVVKGGGLYSILSPSRNTIKNGQSWPGPRVVMANLGQVLKKQVSGFDFKKPGYPGRVLGFPNCTNLAKDWKIGTFCQITKLLLFISPKYGNFKLFSEFLNSILPQSEIFLIHQFDKPHA